MHARLSIFAFLFLISIAFAGQMSRQIPQPTHILGESFGFVERTEDAKDENARLTPLLPSPENCKE
jgi:hypothetical protein